MFYPAPISLREDGSFAEERELNRELVEAVKAGQTQKVAELIEAGADPNSKIEAGETVLYDCVQKRL